MKFQDSVLIKAPQQKVWEFITNAEEVARCAPGVESVEEIEPMKKYKAVASIGFGGLKVKFNVNLEFVELDAPKYARIKAHATAPGSAVDVLAPMYLTPESDTTTTLGWEADVNVMGTIASLANRMMGSVTQKLASEFYAKVKERIEE